MKKISIIIPVYFNQLNLPHLFRRLVDLADKALAYQFEFIFVDDNSGDASYSLLREFAEKDQRAIVLKLSRNFGSFEAIRAGLHYSSCDCAVMISADLQDPPELIPQLLEEWEKGNKVVMAVRQRRGDPLTVRLFARAYYLLMRRFALRDMPAGGFDFALIDRRIIDILKTIKEKNTSLMGLILWSGFQRSIVYYTRTKREHGESMWTMTKKIKYFIDSFVAFSYAPIRLFQCLGFGLALIGFAYAVFIAILRIIYKFPVPGLSALIVITLIIGGVQLIMLGVIGEYLWRNADDAKNRPLFIVEDTFPKGRQDDDKAGSKE
jgi:dolichol-phosphate mannosyltransferase